MKTSQSVPKYSDLLSRSEQQQSQDKLQLDVERAKNQLAADLTATKSNLLDLKDQLNDAYGTKPPHWSAAKIVELRFKVKDAEEVVVELELLNGMF